MSVLIFFAASASTCEKPEVGRQRQAMVTTCCQEKRNQSACNGLRFQDRVVIFRNTVRLHRYRRRAAIKLGRANWYRISDAVTLDPHDIVRLLTGRPELLCRIAEVITYNLRQELAAVSFTETLESGYQEGNEDAPTG